MKSTHLSKSQNKPSHYLLLTLIFSLLGPVAVPANEDGVRTGDRVALGFTCHLSNGELAATTGSAAAGSESISKSPVYLPRRDGQPLVVEARDDSYRSPKESAFEEEIIEALSRRVVGKKPGQKFTVQLSAENITERDEKNYVLQMARVRKRVKQLRLTVDAFKARTGGREPTIGQPFTIDPSFPGTIESIDGDEVVVSFPANTGDQFETPFGMATIQETTSGYDVIIDAKPGRLVRSGPFVGRITRVDDDAFTIDYRHPFGGEFLNCECVVAEILPKTPTLSTAAAGKN